MIGSIDFPELNKTYYRANPDVLIFPIPITSTTRVQEKLDTEFELSNDEEATAREANGDREPAEEWNVRTFVFRNDSGFDPSLRQASHDPTFR